MKRLAVPATVLAAAAGVVALLVFGLLRAGDDRSIDAAVAAHRLPVAADRTLPLLGRAGTLSLARERGKVVVLNFWASWCGPCRAEAPLLERAQPGLAAHGGTVLGVSYEDAPSDAEAFVRRYHLTYPTIRDVDSKLAAAYATKALPETFVIDRRGRIVALRRGEIDASWLRSTLRPLVGAAGA